MIDRRIARYTLRRGLENERLLITPLTGELIYTTDSKRVYVGDGNPGGYLFSNRNLVISATTLPHVSSLPAVAGDFVVNLKNNSTYVVSGSGNNDYYKISQTFDFGGGLVFDTSTNTLSVNVDNTTIYVNPSSSLSVKLNTLSGLDSNENGLYAKVDNITVKYDVNGKLTVDLDALETTLSGYSISSTGGIAYGDTIFGPVTARTLSAVLDDDTITLNPSGAISIKTLPISSVGRIQCKQDIISGGNDPISFDPLSGLYLDLDKLRLLFGNTGVKLKKFTKSTYAESANTLGMITLLGSDGIVRHKGRIHDYDALYDGYNGAGVGPDSDAEFCSIRNLPLSADEEVDEIKIGYTSMFILTNKGRLFFAGRNVSGCSGILADSTVNENNNSADGWAVNETYDQRNKNFFVDRFTEVPLSGAIVKKFNIATGAPTSNTYTPRIHVTAVASISGNSLFQNNSGLSAFSHGAKTAEYIGISWGCNLVGQLGDNTIVSRHTPSIIFDRTTSNITPFSVKNIFPISTRVGGCTYLIDSDDQVWATGANYARNLGVPSLSSATYSTKFQKCYVSPEASFSSTGVVTLSAVIPLKAESLMGSGNDTVYSGKYFTCVFALTGGKMYSCGSNAGYQAGNNRPQNQAETTYFPFLPIYLSDRTTPLSDVVEMTMTDGSDNGASVYARTTSKLYGWGRNIFGELGIGTTDVPQIFPTEITLSGASIGNIKKMEAYGVCYSSNSTITFTFLTNDGDLYTCGNINKMDGSNMFLLIDEQKTTFYRYLPRISNTFFKIQPPTNKKWNDFRTYGANHPWYGAYINPHWLYSPYQNFTFQYFIQTTVYASTEEGDLYGWGSNIFRQIKTQQPYFRNVPTYINLEF